MAAPIGNNHNPNGRPKGLQNKTTQQVKEFYAMILERQEDQFLEALERVHRDNPKAYLELLIKLSDKFLPNLSRVTVEDPDGNPTVPFQVIIPSGPKKEVE